MKGEITLRLFYWPIAPFESRKVFTFNILIAPWNQVIKRQVIREEGAGGGGGK